MLRGFLLSRGGNGLGDTKRAGHTDCVINDAALDYMREHALAGTLVQRLATHKRRPMLPMSNIVLVLELIIGFECMPSVPMTGRDTRRNRATALNLHGLLAHWGEIAGET